MQKKNGNHKLNWLVPVVMTTIYCNVYALSIHEPDYSNQLRWDGECSLGTSQSPINILTGNLTICPKGTSFSFDYSKSHFGVHPAGANLRIIFANQTFITYTKNNITQKYRSLQYHWHQPAQHKINSHKYAMQLHIVHQQITDLKKPKLAVVAILFQQHKLINEDIFDEVDFIDDSKIQYNFPFNLQDGHVFHYSGSLTVPTCDENLEWFVYKKVFKIRTQNLNKFKKNINHGNPNARSVQNLNGRVVEYLRPNCNIR